jgi:hypothetical protein
MDWGFLFSAAGESKAKSKRNWPAGELNFITQRELFTKAF